MRAASHWRQYNDNYASRCVYACDVKLWQVAVPHQPAILEYVALERVCDVNGGSHCALQRRRQRCDATVNRNTRYTR